VLTFVNEPLFASILYTPTAYVDEVGFSSARRYLPSGVTAFGTAFGAEMLDATANSPLCGLMR
jgi:hypothetical protein